ncbi:MAG: hypothetical protein AAGF75_04755 [Cyanobacteria bacterium P01_H01_bin.130]
MKALEALWEWLCTHVLDRKYHQFLQTLGDSPNDQTADDPGS